MARLGRKRTGFGLALGLLLLFAVVFKMNFHTVVVSGRSMEPTFHTGRRLLVSKAFWLVGAIRDGDIVVVTDPNPDGYIVKRVYKMGGENVDWINVPKNYSLSQGEYTVPAGDLYLLGDNRPESEDSRYFGPVAFSRLLGKVVVF